MAEDFVVRFQLDVQQAITSANRLSKSLGEVVYALGQTDTAGKKVESSLGGQVAANNRVAQSSEKLGQSLNSTRYALYDVSQTLAVAGAALVGITALAYGASIAFERSFANVVRTSQVSGDAINTLRENFMDLGADIPVALSQLMEIGTLGGQLGIAAQDLSAFTSVVARFAATTNLSADEAATAFGRLRALLPDVADGSITLEALASSILAVGTNSVATESEITRISVQLSSMAGYAGLTADELIGLSGALASVGTQPELARGTITRLFTLFGKAVSEQGPRLAEFAKIAGVSAETFRSSFGTERFGPIFKNFINGLGDISASGGDVVATLNELGITSVRDVPALTRLATAANSVGEAGQLINQTFGDAASGIRDASELAEQYAIISGTIAAKLQVLQNNFTSLVSAIGAGGTIFGGALDALNGILETMTEIARNPVGNFFLQLGLVITGTVGILALLGAAAARTAASFLALNTALGTSNAAAALAGFSFNALQTKLGLLGVNARVAALAVGSLRLGILGLVAAASVGAMGALFAGVTAGSNALSDALQQTDDDLDSVAKRLSKIGAFTSDGFGSFLSGINKSLADVGLSTDTVAREIKTLDDSYASLVQSGNIAEVNTLLQALASANKTSVDQILTKLPETNKQLELQGEAAGTGAGAMEVLNASVDAAADYQNDLANSLGITTDALSDLEKGLAGNFSSLTDLGGALDTLDANVKTWAEAQAAATDSTEDSWEDFYNSVSFNLSAYNDLLEANFQATKEWEANLLTLVASGASADAIAQLIALGPEKGAVLVQAAVDDIEGEGQRLIDNLGRQGTEAAAGFAGNFTAQQSLIQAAFAQGGADAATAMQNALISGSEAAVMAVVNEYNLKLANNPFLLQANDDPAVASVDAWLVYTGKLPGPVVPVNANTQPAYEQALGLVDLINTLTGTVTVRTNSTVGPLKDGYGWPGGATGGLFTGERFKYATGGHVRGPGTGTSDDVPAWLSAGEYVIKAAAVRKYGTGMFDALNRGVAKFASGGSVAPREVISHASPADRALMRSAGGGSRVIQLVVDGKVLAEATDNANANSQFNGSN